MNSYDINCSTGTIFFSYLTIVYSFYRRLIDDIDSPTPTIDLTYGDDDFTLLGR